MVGGKLSSFICYVKKSSCFFEHKQLKYICQTNNTGDENDLNKEEELT